MPPRKKTPAKPAPSRAAVPAVWVKTSTLVPWAENPKKHSPEQVEIICRSIRATAKDAGGKLIDGFGAPLVVRLQNSEIIAGHGRHLAAQKLGLDRLPVRFLDVSAKQAHRLARADNRLTEIAPWDNTRLLEQLIADASEGLDAIIDQGFDQAYLDELIKSAAVPDPADGDELEDPPVPDPPKDPVTKPGDVWELGRHVVVCGDSRDYDYSDCETVVFDPPWDGDFSLRIAGGESVLAFCDGKRAADIIGMLGPPRWVFGWDCVTSWYVPSHPLRRQKFAFWYGQRDYNPEGAHYGDPLVPHVVSNTRGKYDYKPNPKGKHLSDLFKYPITKLHTGEAHRHSKPLDWIRMLLANCTNGRIGDHFAGSGTTLLAAEQLNRACHAIELNPAYCDIIVERWEQLTGGKAKRRHG